MASVKDNLVRGGISGLKGAIGTVTVSNGRAVFDSGIQNIRYVEWFINSGSGGYDYDVNSPRPSYNAAWFNAPAISNGIVTITGGLVIDGIPAKFWVIGE